MAGYDGGLELGCQWDDGDETDKVACTLFAEALDWGDKVTGVTIIDVHVSMLQVDALDVTEFLRKYVMGLLLGEVGLS